MTIDEQMILASRYAELWTALMPSIGIPERDQFVLWAGLHDEELVSKGFNRAARKARKRRDSETPMTLSEAVKYASSVMRNEMLGFRKFPQSHSAGEMHGY